MFQIYPPLHDSPHLQFLASIISTLHLLPITKQQQLLSSSRISPDSPHISTSPGIRDLPQPLTPPPQEVVAVLLRKIKAHEVRDLSGMSALAWAAGSGALGAIETMVARGGVLHLTDKRGETGEFAAKPAARSLLKASFGTRGRGDISRLISDVVVWFHHMIFQLSN